MEFIAWSELATYAGACVMVITITQFTKEFKFIKVIPTQLWSYFIALLTLYSAYYFTGQLTVSNSVLILFNAIIVALSANGGFEAVSKAFPKFFNKE